MTLGTITHHVPATGRPYWEVTAQPHVMGKLKRVLPRVQPQRTGSIHVVDTPDVAADLQWFRSRYPLDLDPVAGKELSKRVDAYEARQQAMKDVLAGGGSFRGAMDPLRPLRDYQVTGNAMMRASQRMILGDDAGLGKTITGLSLLSDPDALPALVVCQTHLPGQWLRELAATWPLLVGHVVKGTKPYDLAKLRKHPGYVPDVIIAPYSRVAGWADELAGKVKTVLLDECQELRNGVDTDKGRGVAQVADQANYVIGLSATPVYNYADEIWSLYSIIAPHALGSREEFLREWKATEDVSGKGARIADPAALGTYLRSEGLLLRRTRADVKRELREPLRIRQFVESDPAAIERVVTGNAAELAKLILDQSADRKQRFVAKGQLDAEIRQATGVAKAPYVAAFVKMLLESEERVVLVGWHRAVYALWQEQLAEYRPVLYTGSESPAQKKAAVDAFTGGDSRVLILSVRSGAGLDGLQHHCSAMVFGELDWSPAVHDQALWRLDRDGQDATVVGYFLVSDQGSDPSMDEVLQLKSSQSEPIRDPNAPLIAAKPREAVDHIERLAESILAQQLAVSAA